jgi:hypothetical protein
VTSLAVARVVHQEDPFDFAVPLRGATPILWVREGAGA